VPSTTEGNCGLSDARLLQEARTESFRLLYDRYAKRIYEFFVRRTRDHETSLDLTSETFARAWLGRHQFRDLAGGSAGPWLFTIARRTLIASVHKKRLEDDARIRLGLLVEREVEVVPTAIWLDDLDQALDALPPEQRRAVELRVLHDLPYDEVAYSLGSSEAAARTRVSRGLSALRRRLKGELA